MYTPWSKILLFKWKKNKKKYDLGAIYSDSDCEVVEIKTNNQYFYSCTHTANERLYKYFLIVNLKKKKMKTRVSF